MRATDGAQPELTSSAVLGFEPTHKRASAERSKPHPLRHALYLLNHTILNPSLRSPLLKVRLQLKVKHDDRMPTPM